MDEIPQELRDAISVIHRHGLAVCDDIVHTWLVKTSSEYEVDGIGTEVDAVYTTDEKAAVDAFMKLVS